MINEEDVWLLERIEFTDKIRKWPTTRKNIFQGCYDVWFHKDDQMIYRKIMEDRLTSAKDAGLIINSSGKDEINWTDSWSLTEKGREYLDMNNQVRVGLGVAVRKGNQILLHKRLGKHAGNCWAFPGGHLEMWESFEECAIRETREEAGEDIKITKPKFWTTMNSPYKDENCHYVVIMMVCDWVSGEAKVMEPEKCECWEWFDWDKLPKDLIPALQALKDQNLSPWDGDVFEHKHNGMIDKIMAEWGVKK